MTLRLALATVLAALWPALPAHADPRSYAVLSLVGDALTVVTYQPKSGHMLDPNRRDVVRLPDPVLDRDVLATIDRAIRTSDPAAAPVLLSVPAASVPQDQPALFGDGHFKPADALGKALKASGATHLIVVTKHRGEANLQLLNTQVGSGQLDGLGFYIDPVKRMFDSTTLQRGEGFIAAYAYVRASLIDLATFDVVREHAFTETHSFASSRPGGDGVNPWTALSSTEKVDVIERLLRSEMRQAVPELLAP